MLSIGVIGTGAIGQEHIDRITNKLTGGKVTAVYDVFAESAEKVAALCGAKVCSSEGELIDIVDAVICTSIAEAHAETALASIAAGKPIFCEKPLAVSAADAKRVVDAEVAAGKHLVQVGFMRRYDKGYQQVKQMVDSGEYGLPLMMHCAHRNPKTRDVYQDSWTVTGTAIHEIDCMHWLADDEYESAQVVFPRSTSYAHEGLHEPQFFLLKTKKGVLIDVEVFVNCQFGYDIECEVVCENGIIRMPEPSFPMVRRDAKRFVPLETDWKRRFTEAYDVEIQDWINSTVRGEVNGPSAWDGYFAAVTGDALLAAQKSGAIEKIDAGERPAFYNK